MITKKLFIVIAICSIFGLLTGCQAVQNTSTVSTTTPNAADSQTSQAEVEKQIQITADLSNGIIASGDYLRCAKELTDVVFINNCEYNILYSKALNSKDISFCKKMSDPEAAKLCEADFNSEPKALPAPTN